MRIPTLAASIVVCVCLGVGGDAHATLGGDLASVTANHQLLGGEHRVERLAAGERHELQLPSGIVVREYVSPSGVVYAITWHGPRMPDLRELLGSNFEKLSQSDRVPGAHHRTTVKGADLVMQSSGHRRSFSGRAWVPSLVPPGVDIDSSLN